MNPARVNFVIVNFISAVFMNWPFWLIPDFVHRRFLFSEWRLRSFEEIEFRTSSNDGSPSVLKKVSEQVHDNQNRDRDAEKPSYSVTHFVSLAEKNG